jgi:ribosomal protein S18 acetylase RimI-like enzyme
MTIIRTTKEDKNFEELVKLLDKDLNVRYGELQKSYNKHNKIATLDGVVVAFVDDKAVGCGAIRKVDERSTEVKRMFVLPTYRKQGIAKMVLKELEVLSFEQGFEKTVLETGSKQFEAIAFYQKNGYKQIPNYGQYKDNPNSLCYEKSLIGGRNEDRPT